MIAVAFYRLYRLRWAVLIALFLPLGAFTLSLWIEGRYWRADWFDLLGGLVRPVALYALLVLGSFALLPMSTNPVLRLIAGGAVLFASLPWISGTGGDKPIWGLCLLIGAAIGVWFLTGLVGRIRLKWTTRARGSIYVDRPPEDVLKHMTAEAIYVGKPGIAGVERDGEDVTIKYVTGDNLFIQQKIDRAAGLIVETSSVSIDTQMHGVSFTTVRAEGRGTRLSLAEEATNITLGLWLAVRINDVITDFLVSHRDRIEGRRPVSIRDSALRSLR